MPLAPHSPDPSVPLPPAGKPPPDGCKNVAEFVLDQVNVDFTAPSEVEAVLNAWQQRPRDEASLKPREKAALAKPPRRAAYGTQLWVLTRRLGLLAMREPLLYVGRIVANLMCMAFFAIIYLETRQRTQDQVEKLRPLPRPLCLAHPLFLSSGGEACFLHDVRVRHPLQLHDGGSLRRTLQRAGRSA